MVGIAAATLLVTLRPRLLRSPRWRATVTPLASIIGSGFLVAAPILGHAAGGLAVIAMAALCAAGWLFGSAIRTNIRLAEPLLAAQPPRWLAQIDRLSDLALLLSYFVSVSYYLNLLADFALRTGHVGVPDASRWLATAIIAGIGLTGFTRGLHWLEDLELPAVGIKLALIAGLTGALILADGTALAGGTLPLVSGAALREFGNWRVLFGLIVLVQGFETSRYLGDDYDAALRIKTMRMAQILSTLIYLAFVGLATPYLGAAELRPESATEVIDLLAPLGWAVAPLIIVAALASQFSAGVADMSGAGGLASESTGRRIAPRIGYLITALVAITITWTADIFEIIVLASKAFVIYYGLQSLTAARLSWQHGWRWRAVIYSGGVALAIAAVVLGVSAGAG